MLTLSEAIKTGRLQDFIAEREAAGIGETSQAEFDEAVRRVAIPPRLSGQTSRSPSGDGSSEK